MRNFPFWRGAIHNAKNLSALGAVGKDIADFQNEPVFNHNEPKLSDAQVNILAKLMAEKETEFSRQGGNEGSEPIKWGGERRGSGVDHTGVPVTLERKKSEIISAIKEELSNLGVQINDENIHAETTRKIWSIWIEQKGGLNTGGDKFLVNLEELQEGVNYLVAIPYRIRRWANSVRGRSARAAGEGAAGNRTAATILMAEDDKDDCFLIAKALEENGVKNPLVTVPDGEELMDYLYRRGKFSGPDLAPTPAFILLDLNMPRMDGREALKAIKKDEKLRKIPVVILTTSQSGEDVLSGYESGANSYITKPSNFDGFVKIIQTLQNYWLGVVQLPVS